MVQDDLREFSDLGSLLPLPKSWQHFPGLSKAVRRVAVPEKAGRLYFSAMNAAEGKVSCARLLEMLRVSCVIPEQELERLPRKGPVVVVANHPFGLLEGIILAEVLPRLRPDVKVLANWLLSRLPGMEGPFIFVDPFAEGVPRNIRGLREAIRWVQTGGLLVVFPAGEVAHFDPRRKETTDPRWSDGAARIIRLAKATAVPVFFSGSNSLAFQLAGLIHPRLRTACLIPELLSKSGQVIRVRVGKPIRAEELSSVSTEEELTRYLRWRTYLLSGEHKRPRLRIPIPTTKRQAPVIAPVPSQVLAAEVGSLPPSLRLAHNGELSVWLAEAVQIPSVLREIGRLRETTFRAAGEGSGSAIDLDRFDEYYQHLFVWNHERSEVVGGYRLCRTARVLADHGVQGLYTSTLFDYEPGFFRLMGPGLELGRSFVRLEYQKQFAPLLLLWKGVGVCVSRNPEHSVLFGPVSISRSYCDASHHLFATSLSNLNPNLSLAKLVHPRRPYRRTFTAKWDEVALEIGGRSLDLLSAAIEQIEGDGKGIPTLLKQYLKLGGTILGFSVDKSFSDVLDALMLVDLRKTPCSTLERYMTAEGARRFITHHRLSFENKTHQEPIQ